jgi:uncharacterized protein YjbJ (UPF0337 family)
MSTEKKAEGKADEVKGMVKKNAGEAVGNDRLVAEGKADEVKGDLKQAGEKIKDAFKK